jgi:hypothetical protein
MAGHQEPWSPDNDKNKRKQRKSSRPSAEGVWQCQAAVPLRRQGGIGVINNTLFEILVYSCDQEAFLAVVTAKVDKQIMSAWLSPLLRHATDLLQQQQDEEFRLQYREKQIKRESKPIRYNELVGCIEVHSVFTQLRADYWFTEKKRIIIGTETKGIIRWCGKLLEKEYRSSKLTSREIFQDFRSDLGREAKRHARLGRRHIDFEAFDRCGPLVDWRAALQLENVIPGKLRT